MGYLLAQEWATLMLSLALAAVRKFMVTELQWLTLQIMYLDRWKVRARKGRSKDSEELHSDEQSAPRLVVELR